MGNKPKSTKMAFDATVRARSAQQQQQQRSDNMIELAIVFIIAAIVGAAILPLFIHR